MKRSVAVVVFVMSLVVSANAVKAEEPTIQLQEVVVTATKTEKDPKDVTQTVTVITADEIKKSGATTAAEVIKKTAGVEVNDYGPDGALSNISIRGSRFQQVLVLLDGIRLNSVSAGGFDMSDLSVPLAEIERIEIVRGPSSALYGADAVGGVVNIITKRPEKTVTSLSAAIGTDGYDSVTLGQSGRAEHVSYAVSATRETSDGFRVNSDLDEKKLGLKIGYDFSKDSAIELSSHYIDKDIGVPGALNFQTPFARQMTKDTVTGLGYRTRITSELDLKVNATCHRDKLVYQDPQNGIDSTHRGITRGADTQVNWLAGSWNLISVGAEVRRDYLKSSDAGEHAASLVAGYIQDELTLGDSLIVIVGGRSDDHSVYGGKFSPKASARYLVSSTGTIIRASYGKAFRAPTFDDLYWPYSSISFGLTFITEGNPNLKPETSREYEAGVEQKIGKAGAVKVTGFQRKVENLIDWVQTQPNPTTFHYSPENVGKALIRGSEYEVKVFPAGFITIALNYTYTNPVDEVTGEKIYYTIPKSQTKGSIIISLPTKTTVAIEGRAVENYVKSGESDWKYSVFDGKITQTVLARKDTRGEVFFGIKNAFDRKFETVRNYPMPPREIYGGMAVQF